MGRDRVPDVLATLQGLLGDRYQLEGELGSGGMATVYGALDRKHGRRVAVKVLAPDISSLLGRERFAREIQIAAGLQHPNIVPLFDSGGEGESLYYVMPLVAGQTLRERLERETQLSLDEAVAIVRDVAAALDHAHQRDVVHRDIKPENILLQGGRALVTDFGIARAISEAGGERLTRRGVSPGTPAYMSPEQAGGAGRLDGRSDVYALGCVVYEMLAGEPPFTGRTAQAVLARHLQEKPRSLQVVRPTVSLALQEVVERALAKVPADRYATATEFAEAVARAAAQPAPAVAPAPSRRRAVALAGLGLVATGVVVWGVVGPSGGGPGGDAAAVDTSRYVIFPVERQGNVAPPFDEGQLLRDALNRWQGIAVVDPFLVRDALARRGDGSLGADEARRIAAQLGAGRYIRAEASPVGDSVRVHAAVFDAGRGVAQLFEHAVRLARDFRSADSSFGELADALLLRGSTAGRAEREFGTRSLPARQAFARGFAAIEQWDLAEADSAFASAASFDDQYAEAHLWLALTRWWADRPVATWRSGAEAAQAEGSRLARRDSVMASALATLGASETVGACATFGRLARRDTYDFAAWYSWATCLRRDSIVVRDRRSPSRWSFRSSYHQALTAYRRALVLLPSMHRSLRAEGFQPIRSVLMTSGRQRRRGQAAPPDTGTFAAAASWSGDTLALTPYPLRDFDEARRWTVPSTLDEAVRRQRGTFREVATAWVAAFPSSPEALEALAVSLELLGDRACLDSLSRARTLARDPEDRARLASAEVWMRLKFAIPDRMDDIRSARRLADSLLGSGDQARAAPWVRSGLAALTGRARESARLSRDPRTVARWDIPAALAASAPQLLVYAALGGPAESLAVLERLAERAISGSIPAEEQGVQRARWLVRPATIALPSHRFNVLQDLAGDADWLARADAAFLRGDTATVLRELERVRAIRSRPADVPPDALYPEAWLLAAMGHSADAAAWLDPTLAVLAETAPQTFADPVRSGALVRALALRAEVAAQLGDSIGARRWSAVVTTLWSDADAFLQPVVERMRQMSR